MFLRSLPGPRAAARQNQACRVILTEVPVRFERFSFGSLRIDGVTYDHDVVIDNGEVRKRNKKPSKKFRKAFGHTPLSLQEEIPLEMQAPNDRNWKRRFAGHGGSEARSRAPQDQAPDPADC
jgi:hypothetical protein